MPYADSEAMQLHLVEISSRVRRGAHAVLLLDRAGWHTTRRLVVPKNITLVFLPSRAPELNPVENIWQYLRQNWLSNRVFETYEAIIEAACEAWRSLLAEPTTITSIGHRGLGARRSEMKAVGIKASFDQAAAQAERANAQLQLAEQNYDRQAQLFKANVVAQATLDTATRNLDASKQSFAAAKAEEERARLAYTSNIGGVNTAVAKLRAELADAEFDLEQTTTRAAGPGFVTQVSLRPGMYAIPAQLRTSMFFVNTGPQDRELGAAFQQNSLQRVKAGDDAEVAFDAVPGRVFKGKVRTVVDAISTGQLGTTVGLIEPETRTTAGRAVAIIDVSDEMRDYQIPLGATAQVAIYTEHWHHLSLLRKVLLRMRSWQNYVFLARISHAGEVHRGSE